ncbi:unnamed protein product [Caenorhabditis nigoni]
MGQTLRKRRDERILKRIEEEESLFRIIAISNLTKNTQQIVKKRKLCVYNLEIIFEPGGKHKLCMTYIDEKFTFNLKPAERFEDRWRFRIHKDDHQMCDYYYNSFCNNHIDLIIRHLMNLFDIDHIETVKFHDPEADIQNLCNISEIVNATGMVISKPTVTKEELDFIKLKFHQLDFINFVTTAPAGYEGFALGYKNVVIQNETMLNWAHLSYSQSTYIKVRGSNITSSGLNQFLKSWIRDRAPKNLEMMIFESFIGTEEEIFKGIKTSTENLKMTGAFRKDQIFGSEYWKRGGSVYIERDDYLYATISIRFRRMVIFAVWTHEKLFGED